MGTPRKTRSEAIALRVAGAVLLASALACRNPHFAEGSGGQSGDEGVAPRFDGTGGSAAQPPLSR